MAAHTSMCTRSSSRRVRCAVTSCATPTTGRRSRTRTAAERVVDMSADIANIHDDKDSELQRAVAAVYGGPFEDFVRRRDALAKELRAAGNRDAAALVKNLRKPSRAAWAL